ncbi:trypsin-like peptidase domain-containing protein [Ruminococcus sp. OA3]|uniref:S1C family serine protease n=1 Tax=Ruminococcus sp. OA3 TaxID=2914164 RepID=UPI001F059009|nr:trypsin-like peptidase domain-containing protein [Ruminococcus sp. OA3]MCH1982207.1 trypsin-like peptidase domain-containing protein [Ruminococcus sp. OA3]
MSDEWNKDGNGFDSVPLNDHTESEDQTAAGNQSVQPDVQSHSVETGSQEQSDTTYSWVNPKLQQQSGEEDRQEWDSRNTWSDQSADQTRNTQSTWGEQQNTGEKRSAQYDSYHFSNIQAEPPKKEKRPLNPILKKFGLCAALALVFGLISGFTILGITSLGTDKEQIQIQPTVPSTETATSGDSVKAEAQNTSTAGNTVADVARNSMPSLVSISNKSVQEVQDFFGGTQAYESESSGSGIIVGQNDSELLIATNNHVISGANTITVSFIDNTSVEAQIKGTDADNDLAVVAVDISKLSEDTLSQIKVATIGNSDDLAVGEQVVAIGNALGYGQSVTSGYVSALDREVTVENVTANLIQTDAAINPGNSGGALLNMNGELIGINSVKFASNAVEGMGYAIPVSTAEPILDDLMNRETRSKVDEAKSAYLGISCKNVSAETSQMYNMPTGVFVYDVTEGTAAEKAGMLKGDIITKFDKSTVSTYNELVSALEYYEAGETVEVVVQRADSGEYKDVTLNVTLDKRPDDAAQSSGQQVLPQNFQ